jgi:hypothetical protein
MTAAELGCDVVRELSIHEDNHQTFAMRGEIFFLQEGALWKIVSSVCSL